MSTVVQVAKTARQPFGGYLKNRELEKISYEDDYELHNLRDPSIGAQQLSRAVDYLTSVSLGYEKRDTFVVSLLGAKVVGEEEKAEELLERVNELEDDSILSTCRLVGYNIAFRAGIHTYQPVQPSIETIEDIRVMVRRNLAFIEKIKPILEKDVVFEGAYTMQIQTGEGDILTRDALWDLKVLSTPLQPSDTLELLMYYLLGLDSIHREAFKKITKIGIFDPRSNTAYVKNVAEINKEVLENVRENIIGY